ncbi:MAG: 3-oxoacyl-acyl-carrier-protein synthase II [Planctomycetota bacterium]|nr:MAG: 3-oxoacyl-acyl-carrier-protein synthase II [Planctomycetota bacterium]
MSRRVVVTGLGVVTSLGFEVPDFWDRICAGKSGVGQIARFDCSDYKVRFAGEIKDFQLTEHMQIDSKEVKRLDRFVQFAMAAASKAVRQSGMDFSQGDQYRHGVLIGSGIGGLEEIEQQHNQLFDRGPSRVSPFMIPKLMVNAASGNISCHYALRGPNSALIQLDHADVMVTGGSEAAITPMGLSGFARMAALSTRNDEPERASRPWDKDRDGFVMAEGAGVLVLEEYEHAKKRGANILAEILGYGMSADGNHMTAPDPEGRGAARAMQGAIKDSKINPSDIDYVNAHGTSTPLGDKAETFAIKTVFGDHVRKIAVSSIKSQMGHLLGASGGVELVACVLALQNQVAPPTINLDNPDEGCDLDYVPHEARPMPIRRILKNSFGFGGHNACLVLERVM